MTTKAPTGRTNCIAEGAGSSLHLQQCVARCPICIEIVPDMMKSELLDEIRGELRARLERIAKAAMAAHEAATDPGSKAESKYDTRSLEESYLATGQARNVKELSETLRIFEALQLPEFGPGDRIEAGALVGLKRGPNAAPVYFLLAPAAGGLEIDFKGKEITLLSPDSPLYVKLSGKTRGETTESPDFEISEIQ